MDLSKNNAPFGLLDKETQEAFRRSVRKIEYLQRWLSGEPVWCSTENPGWFFDTIYRVKREPMEQWLVVDPDGIAVRVYLNKALADRYVDEQYPSARVVHMREVF